MFSSCLGICTGRGEVYRGNQTIRERGLAVNDKVFVGGSYGDCYGKITGLCAKHPFEARVQLGTDAANAKVCWIFSRYLKPNLSPRQCARFNTVGRFPYPSRGELYLGRATARSRGFEVGKTVLVGGGYSSSVGNIIALSSERPFEAQVELYPCKGPSEQHWIYSKYLA